MGRMGDASELTGVVVLLCSRAGRYINGADILVDGMAHIHSPNLNTYKYRLGGGSVF
jgi:hypothetical protein